MNAARARSPRRAASAAVEFALLSPLLVALLLGMWEVGRMGEIQQILSNAAREGARQAATGQLTATEVEDVVRTYLDNAGVPTGNLEVDVVNLDSSTRGVVGAKQLDRLEVTVSIPFTDVEWTALRQIASSATRLNARSLWHSVKDKEYPNPSDPAIE
jgi:hypothetical protein